MPDPNSHPHASSTPQTGEYIASSLLTMTGLSNPTDEFSMAFAGFIAQAGRDFSSDDPIARARAMGILGTVIEVHGDNLQGRNPETKTPEQNFIEKPMAPEEMRASSVLIAQSIDGDTGALIRQELGIPDSEDPAVTKYSGEDGVLAAAFVGVTHDLARTAEEQGKSVRVRTLTGESVTGQLAEVLGKSGDTFGTNTTEIKTRLDHFFEEHMIPDMMAGYDLQRQARRDASEEISAL